MRSGLCCGLGGGSGRIGSLDCCQPGHLGLYHGVFYFGEQQAVLSQFMAGGQELGGAEVLPGERFLDFARNDRR